MEHEVVVRGEGNVLTMPDLATVHVLVEGDGSSRDEAYAEAARAAAAVDQVLQSEAGALGRVMTAALVVQPRTRWHKGESVRTGWRSYRTAILEVRALERLGDLLAQITVSGGAISNLTWALDPSNCAYDEARSRAGQDARRRAERYARALGIKLGAIAWIAEPGLRSRENHYPQGAAFVGAARAMAGAPDESVDVAPEEITVTASVEVGFAIAGS